jgi:hypothetical protein
VSKQLFVATRFGEDRLKRIDQANLIIDEYLAQGLQLTLRQLYYQFVSRDLIPNTVQSYKNLGSLLSDARMAGLVDWDSIEDRGREPSTPSEWDSISDLVDSALSAFRLPRWKGQPTYAELWVEKDALSGVLEPMSREFHVTLMVNKGYSSTSAMYAASRRFRAHKGKNLQLFYLGDHDPSGEDMVRDVQDRLALFGAEVGVTKIGLTMAQVRQFKPPPNPAKMTDSRAAKYVDEHGAQSWEVDALPPNVLQRLVRTAFQEVINKKQMDAVKATEEVLKNQLRKAARTIEDGESDDAE